MSYQQSDFDYIYKIILIGDSNVGKSNIVAQLVDGKFKNNLEPTIGIDFKVKTLQIKEDYIKIQIWDSGGQEKYRTITKNYYRQSAGIIIVFDVTNMQTFNHVPIWLAEIENNVDNLDDVEIMVIGNKIDLEAKRVVSINQIKELYEKYKFTYMETSAKQNINITEAFHKLVTNVHKHKLYLHCSKQYDDEIVQIVETCNNKSRCSCNIQ